MNVLQRTMRELSEKFIKNVKRKHFIDVGLFTKTSMTIRSRNDDSCRWHGINAEFENSTFVSRHLLTSP